MSMAADITYTGNYDLVAQAPLWALHVVIPGPPCAQGRARFRHVKTNDGREFTTTYDPAKSRSWKGTAQVHMQAALSAAVTRYPFDGPLFARIIAVFPCPAGAKKSEAAARRWHAKANADADNIAKAVMDAGNSLLWNDDRVVSRLLVEKVIGARDEAPRVELFVAVLKGAA